MDHPYRDAGGSDDSKGVQATRHKLNENGRAEALKCCGRRSGSVACLRLSVSKTFGSTNVNRNLL